MDFLTIIRNLLQDEAKSTKLALFDAARHKPGKPKSGESALYEWERTEQGSIEDMKTAYKYTFNGGSINSMLSIDVINDIRNQMSNAVDKRYGNKMSMESHFNEIWDDQDYLRPIDEYADFKCFVLDKASQKKRDEIKRDAQDLKTDLQQKGFLDKTISDTPYDLVEGTDFDRIRAAAGTAKLYFDAIVNRYNKEMEVNTDDNSKTESIIKLVQGLERTHPYPDFNCRTFCVLVLNRELVKNRLCPSIMEDPNVFDYQNVEELKVLVQDGQTNFQQLHQNSRIHLDDPTYQEWMSYKQKMKDEEQKRILKACDDTEISSTVSSSTSVWSSDDQNIYDSDDVTSSSDDSYYNNLNNRINKSSSTSSCDSNNVGSPHSDETTLRSSDNFSDKENTDSTDKLATITSNTTTQTTSVTQSSTSSVQSAESALISQEKTRSNAQQKKQTSKRSYPRNVGSSSLSATSSIYSANQLKVTSIPTQIQQKVLCKIPNDLQNRVDQIKSDLKSQKPKKAITSDKNVNTRISSRESYKGH